MQKIIRHAMDRAFLVIAPLLLLLLLIPKAYGAKLSVLTEEAVQLQAKEEGISLRQWVLAEPEEFDLKMPPELFQQAFQEVPPLQVPKERVPEFLNKGRCHTQGMTITKQRLVISCCFYNNSNKKTRLYVGESFLLSAKLSHILSGAAEKPIEWTVQRITEAVPNDEVLRINRLMGSFNGGGFKRHIEDYRLRVFPKTTAEEAPLRPLLSHPSGLFADTQGYVWNANAVYGGPGSFASVMRYDPMALTADAGMVPLQVPYHLGWVALFQHRFLVGETWGGLLHIIFDIKSGKHRIVGNSYRYRPGRWGELQKVALNDCEQLDATYAICGGNWFREAFPKDKEVRRGKLYLVEGRGSSLEDFSFRVVAPLWIELDASQPVATTVFGTRIFRYQKGVGDVEDRMNQYGGHASPLTLTNEGIAIGPKKEWIYFLPEDLPGGKLIRYRLKRDVKEAMEKGEEKKIKNNVSETAS